MPTADAIAGPLAGIKVLEVAQYIAGPFAGLQLADAGADVIKIERPDGGDPLRQYADGEVPMYGPGFCANNRNKRSIALDLRSPEGVSAFRALAETSDIVLENFRPGVMDRLGIGYEALRLINPRLIYCGIAGFAADGPEANRPSFDTVGQALSGLLSISTDQAHPRMRGPTLSDHLTGLFASNAISNALVGRARTGVGCRIDLTMMDATMSAIPDPFTFYNGYGVEWDAETRAAVSHAIVQRCGDGELVAVHLGGPERLWLNFIAVIGRNDLGTDPRFTPRETRIANWSILLDELELVFATRTRAEWMTLFIAGDVAAGEVLSISEVMASPAVQHAQLFEEADHATAGRVTMMRRAARFDGLRNGRQRPPALLGEHTDEVLSEIGYQAKPLMDQAGVTE